MHIDAGTPQVVEGRKPRGILPLTDMAGLFNALGGGWTPPPTKTLPDSLPLHAARNVDSFAMDFIRHYTVERKSQYVRTARHHASIRTSDHSRGR